MQANKRDLQKIIERIDLARNVYGGPGCPPVPAGWKLVSSSAPDPDKAAGFYARVYKNLSPDPSDPPYAIVFRGTHKGDIADITADINIFLRKIPKQHQQALDFVKKVCADNHITTADVELIGHSSGGYVARTVATVLGANRVVGFNCPGPTAWKKEELSKLAGGDHMPAERFIHIRSTDDVVSRWGYQEGYILEVKTTGDHHGLIQLRAGMVELLKGSLNPAAPAVETKPFSLRGIYNTFSQKITRTPKLRDVIHHIFGNGRPPRSSFLRPDDPPQKP